MDIWLLEKVKFLLKTFWIILTPELQILLINVIQEEH